VEHRFRDDLKGYASFRTDFTSTEDQTDSNLTVAIWDIYHLGAGATFDALGTVFTLGLIYAFGNADTDATVGIIPESEDADPDLLADGKTVSYRYRRLTGLLGFSFGF
jgi:hypothetical protein